MKTFWLWPRPRYVSAVNYSQVSLPQRIAEEAQRMKLEHHPELAGLTKNTFERRYKEVDLLIFQT